MNLEKTILISAILQKKNAEKLLFCNSEIFYNSNNRKVAEQIKKFLEEKKDFDLMVLKNELTTISVDYWTDLYVKTGSTNNFDFLLDKLKQRTINDRMKYLAKDLMKKAHAGEEWTEIFNIMSQSFNDMLSQKVNNIRRVSDLAEIGYVELFRQMKIAKTGIKKIDEEFPYMNGNLIVIAARPRCGKSALALQQCINVTNNINSDNERVLFFSLEMKDRENYARVLSSLTGIEIKKIFLNQLDLEEKEKLKVAEEKLKKNHLMLIDKYKDIDDIVMECKRQSINKRLRLITLDYIQIAHGHGKNVNERVSDITGKLKSLAMDLDCPVLALSQFNRNVEKENREPRLSDMRDSGSIEQDADLVFFIHPTNKFISGLEVVALINAKARSMQQGYHEMLFDKKRFKFIEKPDYVSYSETNNFE